MADDGLERKNIEPKTDHQLALTGEHNINVVQPDVMIICDLAEKHGDDGYYKGVSTLVVEILSESTRRNDLIKKLDLYMVGGVEEYWIADPQN